VPGIEQLQLLGRRAHEDDPGVLAAPREGRVRPQRSATEADRARSGLLGRPQNAVDGPARLHGGRRAERHRLVGEPHVRGRPVGVDVRGHRAQAHPAGRADDAEGGLTAVGDEQRVESHAASCRGPGRRSGRGPARRLSVRVLLSTAVGS